MAKTASDFNKEKRLYSSKYAGTYLASQKYKPKLPTQTVIPGSPEQTGASTHFLNGQSG